MRVTGLFASVLLLLACSSSDKTTPENTLAACQDESDNDGDGKVDCADDDCQVFVACAHERGRDATGSDARDGDAPARYDAPAPADANGEALHPVPDLVAEDTALPPEDTGGGNGFCDPCGYGSLKGRVCAPSEQIYVSGATITIETTDCAGEPLVLTAVSQVDGSYLFESVPCGYQTVHIEKGSFVYEYEVPVKTGELMDVSGADIKMCFGASIVSIAVLWGQWDEMNDIVDRLGFDHDWFYYEDTLYSDDPDWENEEAVQFLLDPAWLAQYNILILNCGSAYQKWVVEFPDIEDNLRDWVLLGGSLYMSDLAWIMGEKAFPDGIDFYGIDDKGSMASDGPQIIEGNQDFNAFLVDAQLAAYVGGGELTVHYGPGPLISIAAAGEGSLVHAKAHIKQCTSMFDSCTGGVKLDEEQPVIVSFSPGPTSGRVVYSGFHVDEQEQQDKYDAVLYYMMFML